MAKRIAIVSSSMPPIGPGGVSSAHYNLYRFLKKRGFTVKVYTFRDYKAGVSEEDVVRFGTPPTITSVIKHLGWLYFKITDPSRIAYNVAGALLSALPCLRMNRVISSFQPDVLVLPDHGCPGLFISKPKGCQLILISHHNSLRFLGNPLWGLHSERDAYLTVALENRILKKVDLVVCPSNHMREAFQKTYRYQGPVVVIPNLVDDELIDSIPVNDIRGTLGLREDAILVYIPSAGSMFKGARFVFEIIRRLSAYRADAVGFYLSGDIGRELTYELRFVPPNARICAPGHLHYHENLSIVKGCSFGVSPSLIESFGMAILEAIFCNVPMISFDVGGNRDIISNGENGFIVPYLDLEGLIEAACRLMDSNFRADIRRKMVQFVAHSSNNNVVMEKFLALIQ